jgi:rubrerythrin
MQKPEIGKNRTGIAMSPMDAKRMMEVAEGAHLTPGSIDELEKLRIDCVRSAAPVGSVPPPATVRGVAKSGLKALKGERAQTFMDRMGARIAFERTGVRVYESLLVKCRAASDGASAWYADLQHFCEEEREHFHMLCECMRTLGGDPTAMTPAADVEAVESEGIVKVVADPMTDVTQSLHAVLVAELADNDAWRNLIEMAREIGQDDMVAQFEEALRQEDEHLAGIREIYKQASMKQLHVGH